MIECATTAEPERDRAESAARSVCDVAIIGAGPAGIATALTLRRHDARRSIVVLGGPDSPRRKIGETLPPGAQAVLRALGLWDALLASDPMAAYGTCAAWGRDRLEANEFIFHPDRRGWHIDRKKIDAMLLTEAQRNGITVWSDAALLDACEHEGRWCLHVRRANAPAQSLDARFVVDASGRAACFADRAGAVRITDDRLVAVCVPYRLPAANPMRDTYALVEACVEGWWYSAAQPDGRLLVACFTDADLARNLQLKDTGVWRAALQRVPHTRARAVAAVADDAPALRLADSGMLDRVTGPAWLATGDAASTFDPLSSQGIMKALRQGTFAAYATADHLAGDPDALPKYEALLQREYREFLAVKREFYGREARWPHAPFWSRRRNAINRAEVPVPGLSLEPV